MRQCKNTLFIVPYFASESLECPICHNKSDASNQNVVIYLGIRKPFHKFAAKVRKCNTCELYYMNKVSLYILKENMKHINKILKQQTLIQQDCYPIIVKIENQTLQTLKKLMRKPNPTSDEFDAFLNSYLNESKNASLSIEKIQRKGTPKYTPKINNHKSKSRGRTCLYRGCDNPAMTGKSYCWDHYQHEKYESK